MTSVLMTWRAAWLALWALCPLCSGKPRELFEVGPEDQETGLEPFYDGNMEPWGVVCVGYVNEGSANHKLLKNLGAVTESDAALWDLQVPMIAAKGWQEEESLQLVRRSYAAKLWEMVDLPPLDSEPLVFPGAGKSGKWKEKEVRKWLLQNAYPTINYRVPGYQGKKQPFPFDKYFGAANSGGVGLVLVKMKDMNDFGPQFRVIRHMRPHMEKLFGRIRFAILEKSDSTLEMRTALKVGNESTEAELILFETLLGVNQKVDNHFHGNEKKYRLLNFTEDAVNTFFGEFYAGQLPTYWASKDESGGKTTKAGELKAWDFEQMVFEENPSKSVLVAFMNAPEDGCAACTEGHKVWASVMQAVQMSSQLRKHFEIYWLDQSRDEHPEKLVPGRVAQPMVVYYPPGHAHKRRKRRRLLHKMSESFFKDSIIEMLEDMLEDQQEEGEDL